MTVYCSECFRVDPNGTLHTKEHEPRLPGEYRFVGIDYAVGEGPAWRVGRKIGKTLYLNERFVGHVESIELAQSICNAMNRLPVLEAKLEMAKVALKALAEGDVSSSLAREALDELTDAE